MIVFKNKGEIDLCSISTFGVSVKESENPIGFFGTGLKYAIAVLLRTGHEVTIYSGTTRVDFGIRSGTIRGQEFDFVTMSVDGGAASNIGFTTQLGKQWEVWMAYREIACNCKDEGGNILQTKSPLDLAICGTTTIVVTGKEIECVYANRHSFILEDEPAFTMGAIEVRKRPSESYFYRGVRVHNLGSQCMFTYNDTSNMDLTEDRTVKYQWEPKSRIAIAYLGCTDEQHLRSVLTADNKTVEGQLDFHGYGVKPSEAFLRAVGEMSQDRLTKINPSAVQVWRDATNKIVSPRTVVLSNVQRKMLDRALNFCSRIGFNVRESYPISIAESLGPGTLGMAMDETIYIAIRCFEMGTKYVAGTLAEEFLHLRHGYSDCSREMQNFLFDKVMSVGEELIGEPL